MKPNGGSRAGSLDSASANTAAVLDEGSTCEEVLRKLSLLNLLQQVATAANEAANLETVLQFTIDRICAVSGWEAGHAWLCSENGSAASSGVWYARSPGDFDAFQKLTESHMLESGIPGRVKTEERAHLFSPLQADLDKRVQALSGPFCAYAFPIWGRSSLLGVFEFFFRDRESGPDPSLMEALSQIGSQVGQVIARFEADAKIRQAELKYRELVDRVQAIFWQGTVSPLCVTFVSAESEAMLGYEPAFWLEPGQSWTTRIHPADRERTLRQLSGIRVGESSDLIYRMQRSDGRPVWLRNMVRGVRDDHGTLTLIGIIVDITGQMTVEEDLRNSRAQLRALSARLQSVREEERISIAREVHDELGQLLTVLKIDLTLFKQNIENGTMEEGPLQDIAEMTRVTDAAIAAVQRIAIELRPMILDDLGILEALDWYAKDFERRTGIECRMVSGPLSAAPERESATAIFRIFQEALTNVTRHSRASRVEASLLEEKGCYRLSVQDNGVGIKPEDISDSRSLGLIGMRERAVVLNGDLKIERGEDGGTVISVRIPRPDISRGAAV